MSRHYLIRSTIAVLLAVTLFSWGSSAVRGELITFAFRGTVIHVDMLFPSFLELNGFVAPEVGEVMSGQYTFDSEAEDANISPVVGTYRTVLQETAISVSVGELVAEGLSNSVIATSISYSVGDSLPSIELVTGQPDFGSFLNRSNFRLKIEGDNLLQSTDLPVTPPSLAGAESASLRLSLDNNTNLLPSPYVLISATLDSLILVPEPNTILLTIPITICSFLGRNRRTRLFALRQVL
jgi:hypothetical protein